MPSQLRKLSSIPIFSASMLRHLDLHNALTFDVGQLTGVDSGLTARDSFFLFIEITLQGLVDDMYIRSPQHCEMISWNRM